MPKRVPIKAAKEVATKYGLQQTILVGWDGKQMHVVTYGTTLEQCEQAAVGGNKIKQWLGFPEDMCNALPARVKRKNNKKENNNVHQPEASN
ncbi:hypothetical protein E4H12_12695 [Candidatus Thorarchaeota archaeon]|nr:MAG: hypothetical protein E4H12_12695 [Candidatus Thorarchaeota archaeon]